MHQGNQGGGKNNSNKRAKRAAAQPLSNAGNLAHSNAARPPGGTHIVGTIPAPDEPTSRPRRGNG